MTDQRDGLEAPADVWSAFIQESMRHGETAGELSVVFENDVQTMIDENQSEQTGIRFSESSRFELAQAHHLETWFVNNFQETRADVIQENEDWDNQVNSGVDTAVNYLFAGGTSLATGNPAPLLTQLGQDATKTILKEFLGHEQPVPEADTDWANNYSDRWRQAVDNNVNELPFNNPGDNTNHPPVEVDGLTYDGNPADYESPGAEFTDSNNQPLPYDEIVASGPEALQAYHQWLEDPAVQQYAASSFDPVYTERSTDIFDRGSN
ncbi:MAG: hypothetical protein GEU93_07480 [Propionibacteriales bacterium]|nr:hypothetical protein [Propionibacteriales bacterium]